MKSLRQIRLQLAEGQFIFSRHAFKRTVERDVSELEIRQAGSEAIMVETYPDDKYGPSLLLLGFTQTGRPLHIQVSAADLPQVAIVTLYEPGENMWQDYASRR